LFWIVRGRNGLKEKVEATDVRLTMTEEKVNETDNRIHKLEDTVAFDREHNMYTFTDQCERMDFASNLIKANCVLLTGII